MDAGGLDVLHDADDAHVFAVADGIGFAFDGPVEVMVEQDLVLRHVAEDVHDVALEFLLVDDDFHPLAAQHVGRADEQGKAEFPAELDSFFGVLDDAKLRVRDPVLAQEV